MTCHIKSFKCNYINDRMQYLFREGEYQSKYVEGKVRVVCGNREVVEKLVKGIVFKTGYFSIVVSCYESPDNIDQDTSNAIIFDYLKRLVYDIFEHSAYVHVVEHRDTDNLHWHITIPNIHLTTGMSLNFYTHKIDFLMTDLWCDYVELKHKLVSRHILLNTVVKKNDIITKNMYKAYQHVLENLPKLKNPQDLDCFLKTFKYTILRRYRSSIELSITKKEVKFWLKGYVFNRSYLKDQVISKKLDRQNPKNIETVRKDLDESIDKKKYLVERRYKKNIEKFTQFIVDDQACDISIYSIKTQPEQTPNISLTQEVAISDNASNQEMAELICLTIEMAKRYENKKKKSIERDIY